jgi:hypothetical protein
MLNKIIAIRNVRRFLSSGLPGVPAFFTYPEPLLEKRRQMGTVPTFADQLAPIFSMPRIFSWK